MDISAFTRLIVSAGESLPGTPLTTSARISALNIVGELLRKVGVRTALVIIDPGLKGSKENSVFRDSAADL